MTFCCDARNCFLWWDLGLVCCGLTWFLILGWIRAGQAKNQTRIGARPARFEFGAFDVRHALGPCEKLSGGRRAKFMCGCVRLPSKFQRPTTVPVLVLYQVYLAHDLGDTWSTGSCKPGTRKTENALVILDSHKKLHVEKPFAFFRNRFKMLGRIRQILPDWPKWAVDILLVMTILLITTLILFSLFQNDDPNSLRDSSSTDNTKGVNQRFEQRKQFEKFRKQYIAVYLVIMLADWM